MKSPIFLVSMLISITTFWQQQIPIGTNTITVKNVSFTNAVNVLKSFGYKVRKADGSLGDIQTEFKDVPGTITHLSLSIHVRNNNAIIQGNWWTNLAPPKNNSDTTLVMSVEKSGSLGLNTIFKQMDDFAIALKGETTYT